MTERGETILILSIKPSEDIDLQGRSAFYDIHLNEWKLGRGVTTVSLEMLAKEKPKLIIECHPDLIEIDDVLVEAVFKRTE